MKISTKGKYGLKAMIDIAVFGKDNCISIKSIAERQHISESYLEQLIPPLKKAGLVKSVRGAGGGYRIAMDPKDIKVGSILRALEDSFSQDCCNEKTAACPETCTCCVSKGVWEKMQASLNEAADSINLAELATEYKGINNIE